MAILKDSTSEIFRSTVASVADVVIADPHSTGCGAAGIYGTPMVMLLDERLRVVQKDFGGDLLTRVSEWISEMETEAEQLSA